MSDNNILGTPKRRRTTPAEESSACVHEWYAAETVTGTYITRPYTVLYCRRCGAGTALDHKALLAS